MCISVTCAEVTEDSSMLAVGFSESFVKVWTLVPQKLKTMKTAQQLQEVNIEAEDVLVKQPTPKKKTRQTFVVWTFFRLE